MQGLLDRVRARAEPLGLAPAEVLALLVLLAGSAALTTVVWWSGRPVPTTAGADGIEGLDGLGGLGVPAAGEAADPQVTGGRPTPAGTAESEVVVHVAGQVRRPGVVALPSGARVADAIAAAGGTTAEAVTDALNLARPLQDGEQVRVPAAGDPPPAPSPAPPPAPAGGSASAGGGPAGPIDLNLATLADLDGLPGVGPVMAQRILDHRGAIGGFADVAQLLEVPGIGPARFAELEPRVRV